MRMQGVFPTRTPEPARVPPIPATTGFGSPLHSNGVGARGGLADLHLPRLPLALSPQTFKTQSLGQLQAQRETKRRQQDNFTAALQS